MTRKGSPRGGGLAGSVRWPCSLVRLTAWLAPIACWSFRHWWLSMAQLSNPGKWTGTMEGRPYDGMSKLTPHQRRMFGDLGEGFPAMRKV